MLCDVFFCRWKRHHITYPISYCIIERVCVGSSTASALHCHLNISLTWFIVSLHILSFCIIHLTPLNLPLPHTNLHFAVSVSLLSITNTIIMTDNTSAFEKMERAVKRLSIHIVDEFEEIKRGTARPLVALLRKLLFYTSTLIMKQMLLRGCPSHVSDKKVVIATFDLLREHMKFSPGITIDQFFTQVSISPLSSFSCWNWMIPDNKCRDMWVTNCWW